MKIFKRNKRITKNKIRIRDKLDKLKFRLSIHQLPVSIVEYTDDKRPLFIYDFNKEFYPGCFLYTTYLGRDLLITEGNFLYNAILKYLSDGTEPERYKFIFRSYF